MGNESTENIQILEVAPLTTAIVRRRAKISELAQVIPEACGEVWGFVRTAPIPHPGRNLALYLDMGCEMNLECGVEVEQPFVGNDRIFCSSTPAGMVATKVHLGPYEKLTETHKAIHQWCAEYGYEMAGPNWELYGHWTDNFAELRTDVFYLLKT